MPRFALVVFVFAAGLVACQNADAAIVSPGYTIQQYANVTDPRAMAFDAAGNLYAGRDNIGSGGGFGDAVPITRVAPDLTVSPFGPALGDPDLVIVDRSGSISGVAGTVLVGGQFGSGTTHLTAIFANQSTSQLLNTVLLTDVNGLAFNSQGKLIIGDSVGLSQFDGTTLTRIATLPGVAVDAIGVGSSDRIFATGTDNTLKVFSASGSLIDGNFVSGRYLRFAFANGGAFGDDLYGVDQLTGELVHVSDSGNVDVVGSGFGNSFVTFGNNGAMYVSELDNDRVLEINAVPEPASLCIWCGVGIAGIFFGWRRNRGLPR